MTFEAEDNKFEKFEQVELSIIEPTGDKGAMITFDSQNARQCELYNDAIGMVLEKKGLRPFHQVGGDDEVGYHAWEMWIEEYEKNKEEIAKVITEIHKKAKEYFDLNNSL